MQAWVAAAGITEGRLFRGIDRHGWLGGTLTALSEALIVKHYAKVAVAIRIRSLATTMLDRSDPSAPMQNVLSLPRIQPR